MHVWHLGGLHPYEQWLTVLVALAPFVVLGLVVLRQRRRDAAAEEETARGEEEGLPG